MIDSSLLDTERLIHIVNMSIVLDAAAEDSEFINATAKFLNVNANRIVVSKILMKKPMNFRYNFSRIRNNDDNFELIWNSIWSLSERMSGHQKPFSNSISRTAMLKAPTLSLKFCCMIPPEWDISPFFVMMSWELSEKFQYETETTWKVSSVEIIKGVTPTRQTTMTVSSQSIVTSAAPSTFTPSTTAAPQVRIRMRKFYRNETLS